MSNHAYDDGLGHLPVSEPDPSSLRRFLDDLNRRYLDETQTTHQEHVRRVLIYAKLISPDLDYDNERFTPMEARMLCLAQEVERLQDEVNAADSPRYAHAGKRAQ